MEHDYRRMLAAPHDAFPASDFFIAAEHIVDWRWPDDGRMQREVRSHDPGKTVSHLASGAKHFEATQARHQSVRAVGSEWFHILPWSSGGSTLQSNLRTVLT